MNSSPDQDTQEAHRVRSGARFRSRAAKARTVFVYARPRGLNDMTNPDDSDRKLTELHIAKNPFEAKVIAAVLEDAGLTAYVEDGSLTDEFAMSQRLMNLKGVTIMVRVEDLEAAQEALEASRKAGKLLEEGLPEEGDDGDGGEQKE